MTVYRIIYIPTGDKISIGTDYRNTKEYWKSKTKAYFSLINGINTYNEEIKIATRVDERLGEKELHYCDFLIIKTNEKYSELKNG
jgi:hypothetical protein